MLFLFRLLVLANLFWLSLWCWLRGWCLVGHGPYRAVASDRKPNGPIEPRSHISGSRAGLRH